MGIYTYDTDVERGIQSYMHIACTHIHICIYTHVHMYTCTRIHIYTYTYVHIYTCTHIHIYKSYTHTRICHMFVCVCALYMIYTCMSIWFVYVYMCICIMCICRWVYESNMSAYVILWVYGTLYCLGVHMVCGCMNRIWVHDSHAHITRACM